MAYYTRERKPGQRRGFRSNKMAKRRVRRRPNNPRTRFGGLRGSGGAGRIWRGGRGGRGFRHSGLDVVLGD